jgi:hypothetical protein
MGTEPAVGATDGSCSQCSYVSALSHRWYNPPDGIHPSFPIGKGKGDAMLKVDGLDVQVKTMDFLLSTADLERGAINPQGSR